MTVDQLIANYPRLYHMAEADTWPMIRQRGLLSTEALLDLYEINGERRKALQSCHRGRCEPIEHEQYGRAVIRDQIPMSDNGLKRALAGSDLTPQQWYELLNGRVFFWLREERLSGLLGAKEYRHQTHTVLTVDTASLVARHADKILLSPMNSGCTKPYPHPRGRDTFRSIADFPFAERAKTRNLNGALVELTVRYSVPDIADHATRVVHMKGTAVVNVLYER